MEKLKKAMHDHACFPARETGSMFSVSGLRPATDVFVSFNLLAFRRNPSVILFYPCCTMKNLLPNCIRS